MTLERILQAAVNSLGQGKRKAHCGHHNGDTAADIRSAQCEVDNFGFAREYGEPGYTNPEKGIVFANWNYFPRDVDKILERAGFEIEWSDEWYISYETGKAYRSSPNCYSWTPYYVMRDDGDIIGGDEIESGDQADWYVNEYLLNNPRAANVFKVDLASFGFRLAYPDAHDCASGVRESNVDDPRKTFKQLQIDFPAHDVVFDITGKDQFEVYWRAWIRPQGRLRSQCPVTNCSQACDCIDDC